jgi:hypothetical protein
VLTLALALAITLAGGRTNLPTIAAAIFFMLCSVALIAAALFLSGRNSGGPK